MFHIIKKAIIVYRICQTQYSGGLKQLANVHMQCFFEHSLNVLKSSNLRLREKVDGLLLLSVYFMPILVLFSWIIGVSLFLLRPPQWFGMVWAFIPLSLYSFVGNFAPKPKPKPKPKTFLRVLAKFTTPKKGKFRLLQ